MSDVNVRINVRPGGDGWTGRNDIGGLVRGRRPSHDRIRHRDRWITARGLLRRSLQLKEDMP